MNCTCRDLPIIETSRAERWAHLNCNTPIESRVSLVSSFAFGAL